MIFGSLALAWCTVLAYHAIKNRCIEEVYMLIALVLWLTGNFVWMAGLHEVAQIIILIHHYSTYYR